MYAERRLYLNRLKELMNNGRVKIITGIRRCGKSFLLENIFTNYLLSQSVDRDHIIYLALDDLKNNELRNPLKLDEYIRQNIKDDGQYYILLDEIQRVFTIVNPVLTGGKIRTAEKTDQDVIGFSDVVTGLMRLKNADVYITGSNSRFLSSDIMTEFRDRGDEIYVAPLTFSEYTEALNLSDTSRAFNEYKMHGGMPLSLTFDSDERKEKYLKDLFSLTYHKDMIERNHIRNTEDFEILTKLMADNVGSLTNPLTIANTFHSVMKRNIDDETVNRYLTYMEEAFILKKAYRMDIEGRKRIGGTYKYYFTDPGLRNARLDFLHSDDGFVMENIIYNELIVRGYSVEVGSLETFEKNSAGKTVRKTMETDFVANRGSKYYYIQSAFNIDKPQKDEEERKPLIKIKDSFKKMMIVRDEGPVRRDAHGITTVGIETFLLNPDSLEL